MVAAVQLQGPSLRQRLLEEESTLFPRRALATTFTAFFVVAAFAPLATASTEPTPNGDIVINGAFTDARPVGHPAKFYLPGDAFFAYDWTTPADHAAGVSLVDDGVRLQGGVFIQQHFNGSSAPDRKGEFFHLTLMGAGTGTLRAELRVNHTGDATAETYSKTVTFGASPTTIDISAASLGLPAGEMGLRSVRLWASTGADITLSRVSVYATNGIETRNIHIAPAGDDVLSPLDAVALLNAGDDGKYSFHVGMAADNGEFLPTKDAFVCLYTASQSIEDRGFPANYPIECEDAYLRPASPAITKTRVGDAFRFDIDAAAVKVPTGEFPGFALYATVIVDGSYDLEDPTRALETKSGYFHVGRLAADHAGFGVSNEFFGPTPLLIDANADGRPDFVQTQDTDGHSVIITPRFATETPFATVITTNVDANYVFDVQVYRYDGVSGAPMDMAGGIAFGMFDASGLVAGGGTAVVDLFRAESRHLSRVDAQTWRVTIPMGELPADRPLGAWAFHNVGQPAQTNLFGTSTPSTDFYSGLRNSVKDSAIADAMRTFATPILLDGASLTRDATFVIRADPDADEVTALDGTLVLGDKGDGTITFEYALVVPDGRVVIPNAGHGIAIYDAAGGVSDDASPGPSQMAHAEFGGQGILQSDGWFRIDIPVSAFSDAKGAVGAWGWADNRNGDGFMLSRDGWYNVLKPAAAAVSTSAAEAALYAPTPIVILDEQLGIPRALASAIAGVGTDLLSVTNPLVNPGFQADLFIEGRRETNDNTGGTMTTPPWFLRLDDKGTGQPTDPRSTHSVVAGKGRLGDNALRIGFQKADQGKSLMLGQILGAEQGGDALVWRDATGVSFDVHPVGQTDITFTPVLRYVLPDGTVTSANARIVYADSGSWGRVRLPLNVPDEGRLLGFYLVMDAPATTTFYLDNIVLEGAKTALGDRRSDISDGYAVIITPENLGGAVQDRVQGADGQYYMYTVEVVDHTQGSPRMLDLAGLDRSFALRTQDLQKGGGILVPLRDRTDAFVALVPAGEVPAELAVPWAFVDAGDPYATLGSTIVNQPASGHFNPLKNALAAMPLADQLDYAATPVRFGEDVGSEIVKPQRIVLTAVEGGYGARVTAGSAYVETTTLTLTAPGAPTRAYAAEVDGGLVPGLVLTQDDLATVTLTTADTRFTRGTQLIAGSPIAQFEVCRPAQETCLDVGILAGEALTFRSTSLSPTGEPLTYVWSFGDGRVATGTSPETTHTYDRPGAKLVNLTVQTPSGKRASVEKALTVNNLAPQIRGLEVTPTEIFTDSSVRARVRAADADGGVLSYAWTVDGVAVKGTQASLLLTPAVLDEATGVPALEKRAYVIGVTVSDGQGGVTSGTTSFTVIDRPTTIGAPVFAVEGFPAATYGIYLDDFVVSVAVADGDDVPDRVDLMYTIPESDGPMPRALALGEDGLWSAVVPGWWIGQYEAYAVAYRGSEALATGPTSTFETREDSAPIVTIAGPATTDVGEPTVYSVSAVDPDGRGIHSFSLAGASSTCDACLGEGPATFTVTFDAIGEHMLTATANDVTGSSAEVEMDVAVDDAISVTMEIVHTPETGTQGYLVRVSVFDVFGAPIAGARVVVEDFYAIVPTAVDTQETSTDSDGTVLVRLRPEAVVVGMPLSRTIVATATAGSLPEAAIQDEETASAVLALRNTAGPLGGLPLP